MKKLILPVILLLLQNVVCLAQIPAEKGLSITLEADRLASGFGNLTAKMEMVLRNKEGRESRRQIRIQIIETENDGDKSLTIFDSPPDVEGTALLTHTHKDSDDDQWLYLPALKRVKRISSRNKSGAFMGSEFSYEDLSGMEPGKYTYKFIGEEELVGRKCFIVERYPRDSDNSGYSRIVSWIDKTDYRPWQEVYYDRKKRLLKTLTFSGYQLYIDSIWRAHSMTMVNHQNGKESDLLWSDFDFHTDLNNRDFTTNSLKRIR